MKEFAMPTITIEVEKADKRLKELLNEVAAGKEVVFKEGDQLVARLIPTGKRIAGLHEGTVEMSPDFDKPLSDEIWTGEEK
jgi:antitoxin (DNA-binding transcriptional repressor) of toxin-antitoxin stability system